MSHVTIEAGIGSPLRASATIPSPWAKGPTQEPNAPSGPMPAFTRAIRSTAPNAVASLPVAAATMASLAAASGPSAAYVAALVFR